MQTGRNAWRGVRVGLAALTMLAAPVAAADRPPAERPAGRWPILVLPFAREGSVPLEGMPEAVTEIVTHGLRRVRSLRVVDSGAVEKALAAAGVPRDTVPTDQQLAEIAAASKARAVLAGRVRQEGDEIRVTTRLVDAPRQGETGRTEEAAASSADPFPAGERAVRAVLRALKARVTATDEKRLGAAFVRPTQGLETYVLYARGRWAVGLGTREGSEQAMETLGKALEMDGNFALARFALGIALTATNNRWKAVGEFRKAIQLDPNFAEAYKELADLQRLSPRRTYDQAIEAYTKAVELEPDYAEAYMGRGDAWQAKGNFEKAIENYKKTLDLDPDGAPVHVSLGRIYYNEKGQYHEAVREYNRAIQLNPALMEAHLALGEVYEEKGLYQDAIARYGKALEIDPRHPGAHYGIAVAYEKVDREKAVAMWEKYLELATGLSSEKDYLDIAKKHLKRLKDGPAPPAR
jgi:tetratricopeptide (TPR) repeat protein